MSENIYEVMSSLSWRYFIKSMRGGGEKSSEGWLISQVIGILSSMGQRLRLELIRILQETDTKTMLCMLDFSLPFAAFLLLLFKNVNVVWLVVSILSWQFSGAAKNSAFFPPRIINQLSSQNIIRGALFSEAPSDNIYFWLVFSGSSLRVSVTLPAD